MTVMLVRRTAKELAGIYYDGERSPAFRQNFPSQRDYVARRWVHFIKPAREQLVDLLTQPHITTYMKDKIRDALVEDYMRARLPGGGVDIVQLQKQVN